MVFEARSTSYGLKKTDYYPKTAQEVVEDCFGGGKKEPRVNHKGIPHPEYYTPLVDVLVKAGCPQPTIDRLLVADGARWNPDLVKKDIRVWNLPYKDLANLMAGQIEDVLEAGQYSLNSSFKYGYNDHRMSHILRVTRRVVKLLTKGNYRKEVIHRGRISALSHDNFNILSRKFHQHGGLDFLLFMFPRFWDDPAQLDIVSLAIHLHTDWVAEDVFHLIRERVKTDLEFYHRLREELGPEVLALIIGDKTDIGPERVLNNMPLTVEALKNDRHFAINLVAKTIAFDMYQDPENPSKRIVYWNILFSPEQMMYTSPEVYQVVEQGKEYLPQRATEWLREFWSEYEQRNTLVAQSTFGLLPDVDKIEIHIDDCTDPHETAQRIKLPLSRYHLHEDIAKYKQQYQQNVMKKSS